LAPTGEITSAGADAGHEHPRSQELIELLFSGLSEQASQGSIIAAGICMDVKVVPPGSIAKTDAICVELEHRDGEAVDVFVPYAISSSGSITYGEIFATPGEQTIFLPTAG